MFNPFRGGYVDWSRVAGNVVRHPITALKNTKDRWLSGQGAFDPYSAQINRAQASSGAYGTERYQAFPKSDGGWDYFKDAKPISEDQWLAESGLNKPGYADAVNAAGAMEQYGTDNGDTGGNVGGNVGDTTGTEFPPTSFLGQIYYNLEDLINAKRDYLDRTYQSSLQDLDRSLQGQTGYTNPVEVNFENVGGEYGRSKQSILDQVTKLLDQYNKGEESALGNIGTYYSNLGDIYQSSRGVRENKTKGEYADARTDVNKQKTENLGALDRSLQDYLYQGTQAKSTLASNYQSALDDLINQSEESINRATNRINPVIQGYNATVGGKDVNNRQGLLNDLIKLKSGNAFRKFGTTSGKTNEKAILDYLYGVK